MSNRKKTPQLRRKIKTKYKRTKDIHNQQIKAFRANFRKNIDTNKNCGLLYGVPFSMFYYDDVNLLFIQSNQHVTFE